MENKTDVGVLIKKELDLTRKTIIELNPNYAQTHTELLEMVDLYLNSKYKDGDNDSDGFKRWFLNISDFRCKTASKSFDLDTKDIMLIAEKGQPHIPVWFMSRELRVYMKNSHWAKLLNDIKRELPRYGTVVVKKTNDGVGLVNLKNLYMNPLADSLEDSPYVIEEHPYFADQFKEEATRLGWDNIEEVIEANKDEKEIVVYERYGHVDGEKKRTIMAMGKHKNVILAEDSFKELPYKELHYDKRQGRWLAKGIIEDLFENQIAGNETVNFKRKSLYWSSKFLFHTADETIAAKMLSNMVNGRVIPSAKGIQRIDMREQNLASFQMEENSWDKNADRKTFSYDVIKGEPLPSGTPLGSARLQAGMAASYFEGIRENFAIVLKDILFDWVIPDFKKTSSKEHILNIVGEEADLDKFDRLVVNAKTKMGILRFIKNNRKLPTKEQIEIIRGIEGERTNRDRSIKMPAGFYNDLKYKIDIVITGESVDVASKLATLQQALSMLATNPAILTNPQTKKVFFKILNLVGISPEEFETETETPNIMDIISKQGGQGAPRQPQGQPQVPVTPQGQPPIGPNQDIT